MRRWWLSRIGLATVMASLTAGMFKEAKWKAKGIDHRFTKPGSIIFALQLSSVNCGTFCFKNEFCVSFNHHKATSECQILNTASYKDVDSNLQYDEGWIYYMFVVPPEKPLDGSVLCPSNTYLIRYDQPVYLKYDFSLDGFTCTMSELVKTEYMNGRTECRLILKYDTDYTTDDIDTAGLQLPYHETMKVCATERCAGIVCMKSYNQCWLKFGTHVQSGHAPNSNGNVLYWYHQCSG